MMSLSPRQSKLLRFIEDEAAQSRVPTLDQMREALGGVSSAVAQTTLSALFDRGFLTRSRRSHGEIVLNKEGL